MPDITMCKGDNCSIKDTCYRHTAKADRLQSWFVEAPIKDGSCEYYWEDKNANCTNR